MKLVLINLIGETQSVFASNILIMDNIFIVNGVFHQLNISGESHPSNAYAIEIDMSKTYDKIEQLYVQQVLQ